MATTVTLGVLQRNQVRSPWRIFVRRFMRHHLGVLGLLVLLILVFACTFAPLIAPWDPLRSDYAAFGSAPSAQHPLGTDMAGRDVWSRWLYGGRVSLSVGLVAMAISTVIGTVVGLVSAYLGGWVDTILQRITEVFMLVPSLFLILIVVSMVGPSIYNVMVVIGLLGWEGLARLVRGQVLALREQEYVTAGVCLGLPTWRILFRHLLSGVIPFIVVSATFRLAGAMLTEAGLSFLGLGVQPPQASWGNMLNEARSLSILVDMPWLWIPPGVGISVAVLAINALGDAVRDAVDPRAIR
jgi:peptide/nickel transport system permease protein